eukprot:9361788-Ditylum_brightwellii.AAC.1
MIVAHDDGDDEVSCQLSSGVDYVGDVWEDVQLDHSLGWSWLLLTIFPASLSYNHWSGGSAPRFLIIGGGNFQLSPLVGTVYQLSRVEYFDGGYLGQNYGVVGKLGVQMVCDDHMYLV